MRRRPLPPGDLIDLDALEPSDREILLKLNTTHGPIFKALSDNRLLICVVGLSIGRRLLKDHASALQPMTLELRALFPEGFMRQMEGECHRAYREALLRGINGVDSNAYLLDLEVIATGGLDEYASGSGNQQGSPNAYLAVLSTIASGMLLRVFFGAAPGSKTLDRLLKKYYRLGPHGIVWHIKERQIKAFGELRDELRNLSAAEARSPGPGFSSSLFGWLCERETVDDTLLGNLIYMVEMGRYDVRGLLRWISKYAAENPEWIDRIAGPEMNDPEQAQGYARAFVLETLRMDQSERLMRNVKQDIVFDGFTIPKGAIVRVCLWEAHKDKDTFPQPFEFDPTRFLTADGTVSGFSPFGLDHHHCPFSAISVTLGAVFLRALARGYRVSPVGNGPAFRGVHHWEPPRGFSVVLDRRESERGVLETAGDNSEQRSSKS